MSMLATVARCAARRWSVFPCNPAGTLCPESGDVIDKQPHLLWPGKPYKLKWGDVATNDPTTIVRWWTSSPEANIGIACRPSGLLVVDCDIPKDSGGEEGFDQYFRVLRDVLGMSPWEATGACDTYTVLTGSGGIHLYYRWPADAGLASQAGLASVGAPLVDIRSNGGTRGGYVLGAGSRTTKGEYRVDYDAPVKLLPGKLVELLQEKRRNQRKPQKPQKVSGFTQPGGRYEGLVDTLRYAQEGNRNAALNWAAWHMASDGLTEEEVAALVLPVALGIGLSEKEAIATIGSACRRAG